jgi:hypothetical protein
MKMKKAQIKVSENSRVTELSKNMCDPVSGVINCRQLDSIVKSWTIEIDFRKE